uniref:hypothetical protein n=1 Tax=Leucobacter chironomi TaxID=491918 RepID=UPI00055F7B61
MPDLAAWYGPLLGQRIDVDGAFPGECHDVGLAWMYALGVQPGDGHAPGTGYTDQVWRQFPFHRPRLADRFLKTHGTGEIGPGSLVYWARYGG